MRGTRFTPDSRKPTLQALAATPGDASLLIFKLTLLIALLWLLTGCSAVKKVGVRTFYRPATLQAQAGEVHLDIAYKQGPSAHPVKHRLDFYRPRHDSWPALVFVHGGSLDQGDKNLRVGGWDVYGNIGRFYAAQGIGVAVINYRLQPSVRWTDQVDDVAAAVRWVVDNAPEMGGDGRVFLSGHSAGAYLATRVALDESLQGRHAIEPGAVQGVIAVSGPGYDLTDTATFDMYGNVERWKERFDLGQPGADWQRQASITPLIDRDEPPFLLIHTKKEWQALARQNQLFFQALGAAGVPSELMKTNSDSHRRMVLALSRPDKLVAARILSFIDEHRLGPRGKHLASSK